MNSDCMPVDRRQLYTELLEVPGYWRNNPGQRPEVREHARRQIETVGAQKILDAGCGRGDLACYLAAHGFAVTACDIVDASTWISAQNERLPPEAAIRFVQCGLDALGFAVDTFNAVVCVDVIEHLPPREIRPAISEMLRVAPWLYIRAACYPSSHAAYKDLHLTVRPPDWWHDIWQRDGHLLDLGTDGKAHPRIAWGLLATRRPDAHRLLSET